MLLDTSRGTAASLLFLRCLLPKLFLSGSIKLAILPLVYFSGKKVARFCNYRQQ